MYGILQRSFARLWNVVSGPLMSFLEIAIVSQLCKKLLACLKPEGSLPSLQHLATFPVQNLKNPVHIIPSQSFRSILMSSSYLHLGLPRGLLPSDCSTKVLYAFLTRIWKIEDLAPYISRKIIGAVQSGGMRVTAYVARLSQVRNAYNFGRDCFCGIS